MSLTGGFRNKNSGDISIPITELPYIYRVYQHLRDINPEAYEPHIIAIGPYHRGKEKTRMMEAHKKRYLESILHRTKVTEDAIFSAVAEISSQAMAAYSDCVEISSLEFVKMLVMDGCFIVELARKFEDKNNQSRETDPIFQMEWMMTSLQRDLMLFENQIPFFVLCKIYDVIFFWDSDRHKLRLPDLLLGFFKILAFGKGYKNSTDRRLEDIKHLLDLIHGSWEPPKQDHAVEKFDWEGKLITSWRFIGSVTDLKEANIQFRKKEDEVSLFQIEFADGILRIPTLVIENRTESFIRNLIAYEQYHPVSGRNFITDYVVFVDCLIDSSADVKLLQLKGIIENWLGDNEAVASFINKITDSVSGPNQRNFRYAKLFGEINRFCGRNFNRHMAILRRDYFNSPWTISSFGAAVLLLGLTALSTIFTGIQTFKKGH